MWVLQRAREFDQNAGMPLPAVFERLTLAGVDFRSNQISLIASAPGIGKSILALTFAVRAEVPTIYFTADSDATTQYARAASMLTGDPLSVVNEALKRKNVAKYDIALNRARHVRFVLDSAPSLDEVNAHVMSYGWAFGQWPRLIIIDNVSNIFSESEGYQGLEDVMSWLHQLAGKTGAHIMGLHHVTGEHESGDTIVDLKGLRGKISKLPTLILTLNRVKGVDGQLNISIVKNRSGVAAANGSVNVSIGIDLSRMWMETTVPKQVWSGSQSP